MLTRLSPRTLAAPATTAGPKHILLIMMLIVAAYFCCAFAITRAMAAESTTNFVKDAAVGNQFEIESSQLALQKAQNADIKQFAQHMIDDHAKAGENLRAAVEAAPDANVGMPADVLDSKHQKMMQKLQDSSGTDFDKLYVKDQVDAHDDTVKLFKAYAKNGDSPAIKSFATQTLPVLQSHQQDIHKIKSSM